MRRTVLIVLAALAAALILSASAAAQTPAPAPAPAPALSERPCPRVIPSPLRARLLCGTIPVPLRHDDPSAGTIFIAFVRIRAATPTVAEGVIVLGSGPGEKILGGVGDLRPAAPLLLLARTRDVALIDQRGVGDSRPALECVLDQRSVALFADQIVACLRRLRARGNDLAAYDTLSNVRDLDLVRQALGLQRVDLFGTSYGARLAHQALRGNPPWVRSVILSSPLPLQFNAFAEAPASFAAALRTTFRVCAADPQCRRAFPRLTPRLERTLRRLTREPLRVSVRDPRTGRTVRARLDAFAASSLLFTLYYTPFAALTVPAAIDALDSEGLVSSGRQVSGALALSLGAQYSFICQEEAAYFGRSPVSRARNLPLAARLLAAGKPGDRRAAA